MQSFTLSIKRHSAAKIHLSLCQESTELSEQMIAHSVWDKLVQQCEKKYHQRQSPELESLGQALFEFLDTHLHFAQHVLHVRVACVYFHSENTYKQIPWEILHNGKVFLANNPRCEFLPIRLAEGESYHPVSPQNRPLHALFMASSPESVQPVLDYEAEEAKIYSATASHPLRLDVEDSGSLPGLIERLTAAQEGFFDVLHITGHADIRNGASVFLLEDELGQLASATAEDFIDALQSTGAYPALLFLSGCKTAQSADPGAVASLAQTLADIGVASVFGWAKQVNDSDVTEAAGLLYAHLATGASVAQAMHRARRELLKNQRPHWHLLRCFGRADSHQPLVTRPKTPGRELETYQDLSPAYLGSDNQVRVCDPKDYIGHRRLLQRCLRALQALPSETCPQALLLHGTGGLGKSATARKLLARFPDKKAIVVVGQLDESRVINALNKTFGDPDTSALLTQKAELSYRLREFFTAQPEVLLVFDDFEQNQIGGAESTTGNFEPAALQLVYTVMEAIRDSGSAAKLIITSRYQPPLRQGLRWHSELMAGLQGADLQKKLNKLPNAREQQNNDKQAAKQIKQQLQNLSGGNPRLLEHLDGVLELPAADREALLQKLQAKQAEFRDKLLIAELFQHVPEKQRRLLAASAVYHIPVPLGDIHALADTSMAPDYPDARRLGLVERSQQQGENYERCSPFLLALAEKVFTAEEWQGLQAQALQRVYPQWFVENQMPSEARYQELFRLALACKDKERLQKVTDELSWHLIEQYRHPEALERCQQALQVVEDWRLYNRAAAAKQHLGLSGAKADFERAVAAVEKAYKPEQPDSRQLYCLWQYTELLIQSGDLDRAYQLLTERLIPANKKLGRDKTVAINQGLVADILARRGDLDEALRIRLEEELPVYEALGDVRSRAVTQGKIADILASRGDLDEALRIRLEEELPVYEALGEVRSRAAIQVKISDIFVKQGKLNEALQLLTNKAIPFFESLNDQRELLVAQAKIAEILFQQNPTTHKPEIERLLLSAFQAALQMQIPEWQTILNMMLQMGIRSEEQLKTFAESPNPDTLASFIAPIHQASQVETDTSE